MKQNTKYLVGHYIIFRSHREKEFHVDYTHDDMESAMEDWKHLCEVLPDTEVEIRKQITETIVARELIDDETMAQSWN